MTRQERPNRSSLSGRERKRKAGTGRPVQAVREACPAGRGDSLMPHSSTSTKRGDVYSRITAEIVATIERGAGEWRAPWFHNGASVARPTNVASGKRYRGINTLALWAAGLAAEYGDGLWGTYKQWQDAGAQVREGERSTTVVLWREIPTSRQPNDDDGDDDGHRRMFARAFSVFNVAQVDGYQRAGNGHPLGEPAPGACRSVHLQPRHKDRVWRIGSLLSPIDRHGVHAALRLVPRSCVVLWRLAA